MFHHSVVIADLDWFVFRGGCSGLQISNVSGETNSAIDGRIQPILFQFLISSSSFSLKDPVVFKGIGHSLNPANSLVLKVLSASPSAYSANPKSKLSTPPSLSGSSISSVSVVQARNNARIVFSGSSDLFSNKHSIFYSFVFAKSGNQQFATEISKWVFSERGHLKAVNVRHQRVGETDESAIYRINDDLEYLVVPQKVWNCGSSVRFLDLNCILIQDIPESINGLSSLQVRVSSITVHFIDLESHFCGTMEATGKVPEARCGQSVSLVGSKLIMFGGEGKNRWLMNDVHVLDPETGMECC
ncbi:hypothetical protein L2E82_51967 [Cichorium intybus]|nr:hypothetical protein L2E82_51967 [Cichorium intybus]